MKKLVKTKVVKKKDQVVFRAPAVIMLALMVLMALAWLSLTVALFFYSTSLGLWIVWGIFTLIILFLWWLGRIFDQMEDLEKSQW